MPTSQKYQKIVAVLKYYIRMAFMTIKIPLEIKKHLLTIADVFMLLIVSLLPLIILCAKNLHNNLHNKEISLFTGISFFVLSGYLFSLLVPSVRKFFSGGDKNQIRNLILFLLMFGLLVCIAFAPRDLENYAIDHIVPIIVYLIVLYYVYKYTLDEVAVKLSKSADDATNNGIMTNIKNGSGVLQNQKKKQGGKK